MFSGKSVQPYRVRKQQINELLIFRKLYVYHGIAIKIFLPPSHSLSLVCMCFSFVHYLRLLCSIMYFNWQLPLGDHTTYNINEYKGDKHTHAHNDRYKFKPYRCLYLHLYISLILCVNYGQQIMTIEYYKIKSHLSV